MLRVNLEKRVVDFLEKIPRKHAGQVARKIQETAETDGRGGKPLR